MNETATYLPCSCSSFEIPKCLCQLQRLNHNSLLFLIISDLRVTRQWEIFPQWMSIETVVRHDASQIWVTNEEYTKQIVYLSLVPVGSVVQTCDAGNWRCFVGVCLDSNTGIVAYAEHIVNDLEPLVSGGVVDGCDVANSCEFCRSVVWFKSAYLLNCRIQWQKHTFQKCEDWNDTSWRDVDNQLVFPY